MSGVGGGWQPVLAQDAERPVDIDDEATAAGIEIAVIDGLREADRPALRMVAHLPADVLELDHEARRRGQDAGGEAGGGIDVEDDPGDVLVHPEAHTEDLGGTAALRLCQDGHEEQQQQGQRQARGQARGQERGMQVQGRKRSAAACRWPRHACCWTRQGGGPPALRLQRGAVSGGHGGPASHRRSGSFGSGFGSRGARGDRVARRARSGSGGRDGGVDRACEQAS